MLTIMDFIDALEARVIAAVGDPEDGAAIMLCAREEGILRGGYLAVDDTLRTDAEVIKLSEQILRQAECDGHILRGLRGR